jgi:predicted Zn-dependent protease
VKARRAGLLATAAVCALLTSCAAAPPAPERDRGREKIIERQQMIWYIGEEYRFVWDPEVTSFVKEIGINLSRAVGASDNDFHFYIIDQPSINAFTTPQGDIFIFSGMLTQMQNSSELAGVLAHEIAHVRADHFSQMQRRATMSTIPGLMAAILSKGDPRVIASTIAAAQSYQLHWSREMEFESDRLAVQYLGLTDYDQAGLLGAMRVIQKGQRLLPVDAPEGLMTHPVTSSRIANMEGGLSRMPGEPYEPAYDASWERMRAVLLALTDRPGVVLRGYRKRLDDGGADAQDQLGLVYARQGNYPAAEEAFRQAVAAEPEDARFLADLGSALFHQGKMEEARDAFLRSLQAEGGKKYSYPYYFLGEIHREAGDTDAGYRYYQSAASSWPPISESHYQLALMLAEREELGEADYHFGKAARLRGDFASALRSFSRAGARLGSDPVWASRISAELLEMQ